MSSVACSYGCFSTWHISAGIELAHMAQNGNCPHKQHVTTKHAKAHGTVAAPVFGCNIMILPLLDNHKVADCRSSVASSCWTSTMMTWSVTCLRSCWTLSSKVHYQNLELLMIYKLSNGEHHTPEHYVPFLPSFCPPSLLDLSVKCDRRALWHVLAACLQERCWMCKSILL